MSSDSAKRNDGRIVVVEDGTGTAAPAGPPWRILVVDDEDDVHQATRFALRDLEIFGRPLQLIHATSRAEAVEKIGEFGDVAVALIDVVMEMPDSGLELVRDLRTAGLRNLRIVLRTGHPGYAPEQSVINEYEIDDYRTKGELTRTRLMTVLTAAIRSYDHLCTIEKGRAGLELIVESSSKLFQRPSLEKFSRGVLTHIACLLDISAEGLVLAYPIDEENDAKARVISASGHFGPMIGLRSDEIPDAVIRERVESVTADTGPALRDGYMTLHFTTEDARGLIVLLETSLNIPESDLALLKLFTHNIAISFETLALFEKLDDLAYQDPILRVPNLNAFLRELEKRFRTLGAEASVAIASVDSFPSLAATYGFATAHDFLAGIYGDLKTEANFVARTGDGIFAVLGNTSDIDAGWLEGAVTRPRQIFDVDVSATATSAILDLADIEKDPEAIMRAAKSALQHVRVTQPGKTVRYDRRMRAASERSSMLLDGLRRALANLEGFDVYLQPKVDLLTGKVKGAEALIRWSVGGEAIGPGEFIPVAESAGLIGPLTDYVIGRVGAWSKARADKPVLPVAINLSLDDLNGPDSAERIMAAVSRAGLSAESVEFEITESVAMRHGAWAQTQIRVLAENGFRFSLDDFGTGFSSLSQFSRLPIGELKIDRSFVKDLETPTARQSLASIVLGMTEILKVGCIAEGIETEEQKQALIFLGCKTGQGYLLGRPTPISEFDATFLRN